MGNLGAGAAKQYEEPGDMKVLCLLDPEPHPAYPEYETCIQQGVSWLAPLVLWGPKGMDPELVEAINAATAGMAEDATAQEALKKADSVFTYYDVGAAQELMATEDAKIQALAEKLGLSR